MLVGLLACTTAPPCAEGFGRGASGACVPLATEDPPPSDAEPAETAGPVDSGLDSAPPEESAPIFALGDALVTTEVLDLGELGFEAVAALGLSEERGMVAGQGGWIVVDTTTGELRQHTAAARTYDLAWDPVTERIWAGTRLEDLYCLDARDLDAVVTDACFIEGPTYPYEDVSAWGDTVVIAAQDHGARLHDGESGAQLSTADATPAWSVGLHADRLVVGTDAELVLFDVSSPDAPRELDRAALDGRGADIAFDGVTVAVAMGDDGLGVFAVEGDRLSDRGDVRTSGSAGAVALDGDYAYTASWSQIEVAWVGAGGPFGVAHEPGQQLALGVGARDGAVVVADWFRLDVVAHDRDLAGPELDAPERVTFSDGDAMAITVHNGGAMDLELELEMAPGGEGYEVTPTSLAIAPGGAEVVVVDPTANELPGSEIRLSTNDPDEQGAVIELAWGAGSVGDEVEDFELPGFTVSDPTTRPYALSDYRGKAVFLAFWAEY